MERTGWIPFKALKGSLMKTPLRHPKYQLPPSERRECSWDQEQKDHHWPRGHHSQPPHFVAQGHSPCLRAIPATAFLVKATEERVPRWLSGKETTCNAGDESSILGSRRSPRGGNGNPLQCPCLGNPMHMGAWQGTDHGAAKRLDLVTKQQLKKQS